MCIVIDTGAPRTGLERKERKKMKKRIFGGNLRFARQSPKRQCSVLYSQTLVNICLELYNQYVPTSCSEFRDFSARTHSSNQMIDWAANF